MPPDTSTDLKYRQAAVTYFIYGIVYLSGAAYSAAVGISERGISDGYGWIYFVVGGFIVFVLPVLIWKAYTWVTRILALLVGVRITGLIELIVTEGGRPVPAPWGGEWPIGWGAAVFLLVAALACAMLVRAGWDL